MTQHYRSDPLKGCGLMVVGAVVVGVVFWVAVVFIVGRLVGAW